MEQKTVEKLTKIKEYCAMQENGCTSCKFYRNSKCIVVQTYKELSKTPSKWNIKKIEELNK